MFLYSRIDVVWWETIMGSLYCDLVYWIYETLLTRKDGDGICQWWLLANYSLYTTFELDIYHRNISTQNYQVCHWKRVLSHQSTIQCCLKLCRIFNYLPIQWGQHLCIENRGNAGRGINEVEDVSPPKPFKRVVNSILPKVQRDAWNKLLTISRTLFSSSRPILQVHS